MWVLRLYLECLVVVQDKAGAPRVGQDAGITTDKLWEVASAQFAEDHKEGWLRKLVDIKVCNFVDRLASWLPSTSLRF